MTYQKAIHNAVTGQTEMIELTPEEVVEVEAKIAANQAQAEAEAVAEAEKETAETGLRAAVAATPSDDDINNARTVAGLQALMLLQAAAIRALAKQAGLE